MTYDRTALYYRENNLEKTSIVIINLSSSKVGLTRQNLEKEQLQLLDFKLVENSLMYMMVEDDNFYKFYVRSLKKNQPSYEYYGKFPGRLTFNQLTATTSALT